MKKNIFTNALFPVLFLIFVPIVSLGQEIDKDYMLLDFKKNLPMKINIKEDWANGSVLIINRANFDTIKIANISEVDNVSILNNRFLKINFRIRSGSGGHIRMAKIFSISSGLIFESLTLLTSRNEYLLRDDISEEYNLDIKIIKVEKIFQVILKEVAKVYSKDRFQNGRSWSKITTLKFNEKNMIFFDKKVAGSKIKICDDIKTFTDYFELSLKNDIYINLKGNWFVKYKNCYVRI